VKRKTHYFRMIRQSRNQLINGATWVFRMVFPSLVAVGWVEISGISFLRVSIPRYVISEISFGG